MPPADPSILASPASIAAPPRKARKPRKAKPAAPAATKPRAPVVRVVTSFLASLSPAHVEAARVLGAEFRKELREELASDARRVALTARIESLERDLKRATLDYDALVGSTDCRDRLDVLARSIAAARGDVPSVEQAEPTDDDRKGVDIPD